MIASMWVGNFLLVVLNLPLIGMWVKLLTREYRFLYPAILLFCCIGVYSISNAPADVLLAALFGFIGYTFIKLEVEPRRCCSASCWADDGGELETGVAAIPRRPGGVLHAADQRTLLVLSALLIIIVVSPSISRKREEAFQERKSGSDPFPEATRHGNVV
jgi:TctA family transporter